MDDPRQSARRSLTKEGMIFVCNRLNEIRSSGVAIWAWWRKREGNANNESGCDDRILGPAKENKEPARGGDGDWVWFWGSSIEKGRMVVGGRVLFGRKKNGKRAMKVFFF